MTLIDDRSNRRSCGGYGDVQRYIENRYNLIYRDNSNIPLSIHDLDNSIQVYMENGGYMIYSNAVRIYLSEIDPLFKDFAPSGLKLHPNTRVNKLTNIGYDLLGRFKALN